MIKAVKVWDYPARDDVVRRAVIYARRTFGPDTDYIEQINAVKFEGITFSLSGSPPGPSRYDIKTWEAGKRNLLNIIDLIIEELGGETPEPSTPEMYRRRLEEIRRGDKEPRPWNKYRIKDPIVTVPPPDRQSKHVFVVHGHDEAMKESVARTISTLKLTPIILHEQTNRGRTIIEKFEEEASDVGFAVVLLSPDDDGRKKGDKDLNLRARQNVILELGFFYGILSRGRVMALYRDVDGFELPSDISGVIYVPFDRAGAWRMDLYRELRDTGYDVNADDIMLWGLNYFKLDVSTGP
jgi:predicted nucleotide-binding protein